MPLKKPDVRRWLTIRGCAWMHWAVRLESIPPALRAKNRQGHYVCVLVAVRSPDDPEPLIAEGTWEGVIAEAPKGSGGFGYDPYFYLPEAGATAAELSPEAKNASSHRGKALVKMAQLLKERWGWGAA